MWKIRATAIDRPPLTGFETRGRIERAGLRAYTVFHADDFAATGLTPGRIEAAFELGNSRVTWSLDAHEEQNAEHRAALQRLLGL